MTYVKVTFRIEADDPDHSTGLTEESFEQITDAVGELGGENVEFEKVDE